MLKWAAAPTRVGYVAAITLLVLPTAWALAGEMATRQLLAQGLETPTNLAYLEDGRIFVLEPQKGHVRVIDQGGLLDEPFLSVQDRIEETGHNEKGLLGIAFPPDFGEAKDVYVVYTGKEGALVLSRFAATKDGKRALADTEETLLSISDRVPDEHNCGHIDFSSDGQLFLCIGDMDDIGNPTGSAQDLATLKGKISRFDPTSAEIEPQIVAYGLKNPWRFTITPSGSLIVPDVGVATWEELNVLKPDAPNPVNLGWNLAEGNDCRRGTCDDDLDWPLFVYPHDGLKCAIVGGALYEGTVNPAWRGVYVFGDYCSGELWAIRDIETRPEIRKIAEKFQQIAAVGNDADGEIIVSDFGEGTVYRLELPSYDDSGWDDVAALVQRQSVDARRAGVHSAKQELESLYSSRRWAVIKKLYDMFDWIAGRGAR